MDCCQPDRREEKKKNALQYQNEKTKKKSFEEADISNKQCQIFK